MSTPKPTDKPTVCHGVAVESFTRAAAASAAIRELRRAGFTADEISVMAKDHAAARDVASATGTQAGEGAAAGLAAGGLLGAAVAALAGASAVAIPGVGWVIGGVLSGAIIGAAGGAVTGALLGLGIPEPEAVVYNARFERGDIIVTVLAGEREVAARRILRGGAADEDATMARDQSDDEMETHVRDRDGDRDRDRDVDTSAGGEAGQATGSSPTTARGGSSTVSRRATASEDIPATSVSGAGSALDPDAARGDGLDLPLDPEQLSTTGTYAAPTPDASVRGGGATIDESVNRTNSSRYRSSKTTTSHPGPMRGMGAVPTVDEDTATGEDAG